MLPEESDSSCQDFNTVNRNISTSNGKDPRRDYCTFEKWWKTSTYHIQLFLVSQFLIFVEILSEGSSGPWSIWPTSRNEGKNEKRRFWRRSPKVIPQTFILRNSKSRGGLYRSFWASLSVTIGSDYSSLCSFFIQSLLKHFSMKGLFVSNPR